MSVVVRIAPSPTGYLHVGNIRLALVNWLFARKNGGRFMLRMDDTDAARSTPEFAAAIEEDLHWLGLEWDTFARQSDRMARYVEVAEALKKAGRLYPCYETAEELALKRKSLLGQGKPPVYDRAALRLSEADIAKYEAEGRTPHWRFKLDHKPIAWRDLTRGDLHFDGALLSDPVLIREDGGFLYSLCSVIDDIDFGITHVVRGEDHISNTASQIQMFESVGGTVPAFAHLSLLVDADGGPLSKRLGSLSVRGMREEGLEPMALLSFLAKLGTSDTVEPRLSLEELTAEFDFAKFSHATPRFDPAELRRLNARLLHMTPYESVRARLPHIVTPELWDAVRGNLETLADAGMWAEIVYGNTATVSMDEAEFLKTALSLLPPEPWDKTTFGTWIEVIKKETGRKGPALFNPIRLALTGLDHGPEMKNLLPLIGHAKTVERLERCRQVPVHC